MQELQLLLCTAQSGAEANTPASSFSESKPQNCSQSSSSSPSDLNLCTVALSEHVMLVWRAASLGLEVKESLRYPAAAAFLSEWTAQASRVTLMFVRFYPFCEFKAPSAIWGIFFLSFHPVHTIFHRRMFINYFLIEDYAFIPFKKNFTHFRLHTLIPEKRSLQGWGKSIFEGKQ